MVKRMSKFPIIVCDDDKDLADQMAKNINASIQDLTDDNEGYAELNESVTFVANDFAQTVGYVVVNDIKNGIYFLDIELSRESKAKNGVDLAEFIKKNDENAQIIFVTAYDKYAPLTYRRRIGAIDYISKSMSSDKIIQRIEETLRDAFDNLSSRIKFGQRDFTYKIGRRICKVAEDNILFIEHSTTQHKVHMVTENGEVEYKGNISQIDKKNSFLVKVSQSYLVNPRNINAIDMKEHIIIFDNDKMVTYSRAYKDVVKTLVNKFKDIEVK